MEKSAIAELTSYPVVHFRKGDSIVNYDKSSGTFVYYLTKGYAMRQATLITGEELFFEEYGPCSTVFSLLGPCTLYTKETPASTIAMIALTDITAHKLSGEEFDAFLDRHPEIMKELLTRLVAEYNMLMNNFIAKQKGQAAPRVAGFILERAEKQKGELVLTRGFSISDIARFLGMHRITANKIVLALRNAGAIDYNEDNELVITNAQLLEEFSQGTRTIEYKK